MKLVTFFLYSEFQCSQLWCVTCFRWKKQQNILKREECFYSICLIHVLVLLLEQAWVVQSVILSNRELVEMHKLEALLFLVASDLCYWKSLGGMALLNSFQWYSVNPVYTRFFCNIGSYATILFQICGDNLSHNGEEHENLC